MNVSLAAAVVSCLLLVACEPYTQSNSGVSSLQKKVLYDFRDENISRPHVDPKTERGVLQSIAPHYFTRTGDCPRAAGVSNAVVLRIAGLSAGSFTGAGKTETAYLIDYVKCNEDPARRSNRLAVFSEDKLIAVAEVPELVLLKSYDLNGDGINELLLSGGVARVGEVRSSARLVQFDKAELKTVEDFGTVYDNACGMFAGAGERRRELHNGGVDPIIDAVLIAYLPRPGNQMPSFTAQRFRADCPGENRPPRWTEVTR